MNIIRRHISLILICLILSVVLFYSIGMRLKQLEKEVEGLRIQVSTLHKIVTNKKKE